ncbi:hypothetical protein AVEN_153080-1 [Araneus ventricosus]|uniref:Uncharacterized protein n=1 Tax=Araneus ventricosus TaxID=182803 RepID=A0A4Y2E2Y1_ARAVE|nr:hypothetical protein AVEN_153080-1 [Araneus ventricosus]
MELQSGALTQQLESKGNSTPSKGHSFLLLQEHTEQHQTRHSRSYLEFHLSTSSSSRRPESQPFEDSDPLPDTLTTLVPGEVEKGETAWAADPAVYTSEEQISLVDGGGIASHLHGWLEDRKRCRGSILRLVRTKYSLQMVGKTARLRYSFPGGTSGLETRNRPCNQPPSPANNHSSGQSCE